MEVWIDQKYIMFINIILFFVMLAGAREEIDINMVMSNSAQDGIQTNFEMMSKQELIKIILSQQKIINETGIVSSDPENEKRYGPCEFADQPFDFGHRSRRSMHSEVVDTRTNKVSKQCKKFRRKCSKVCKNGQICRKNKKCKKCCSKCKVATSTYSTNSPTTLPIFTTLSTICPTCPSTIETLACPTPSICPSTPPSTTECPSCPSSPEALSCQACPTMLPPSTPKACPSCPETSSSPACPTTLPPSIPKSSTLPMCLPSTECPTCPSCPPCPTAMSPPLCESTPKYSTPPSTASTGNGDTESAVALNGCYQNYTLSNGEVKNISSPGFIENQNYPNNVNCKWTFTAPLDEKVSITLLSINTELGYDVVRVMDGIGEEDDKLPILATMSGEETREAVISSTSEMTVTFNTDINVNMTGFQAIVGAFKKADLPVFTWIGLYQININYGNDVNETISLSLGANNDTEDDTANEDNACIFTGQSLTSSVIITSPSSTKECKSLDQEIEIVLMTTNLQNYKNFYTMRNGQLEQVQEQGFENNELVRKRNITAIKVPPKIRIPIQFAYEKGLEKKFLKYDQDTSYIKKRIMEIYQASKYSLKNIFNMTNVEFILEKNIMFINEYLELNESTLLDIRKYQIREDVPLVVLCAEDYNSNIKGLSFRSGACRRDKSRFGAIMLTWRDDGGLAADVLEHELSHIIGGVHTSKNGSETEVGHTDFNSQNINAWFNMAGHRCYGKDCSSPPIKSNGSWICDSDLQSCYLKCDRGFTNMTSTIIECNNGNWSENINQAVCSPSVYLVAGGWDGGYGAYHDVEIFHPDVQNLTCHNKPPALTLEWKEHTTFSDKHSLYLCGGQYTEGSCTSYNYITKTWTSHSLVEGRMWGHSSVAAAGSVFLVGGDDANRKYYGVVKTQLPMEAVAPTWTQVTNIKNKGRYQCVLTIDEHNIVIIGGATYNYDYNKWNYSSTVTSYNVLDGTTQELAPLIQKRHQHGCILLEEEDSTWIVVTGGYKHSYNHNSYLTKTERLNIKERGSVWESSGDLNVRRGGHGMALTLHGIIVVGGYNKEILNSINLVVGGRLNSIELLKFNEKKWEVLEASLTKPRDHYGGVVELPAHFFNCEMDTDMQTGCPILPMKENGNWMCDSTTTTCMLSCYPGFSSAYTTTTCEAGVWKDINNMECTESVLVLAGGEGAETNVELYTSDMENITCSNPPPSSLNQDWSSHTTFTHHGTLFLCGGLFCVSNNHNTWRQHLLQEDRGIGLSSVIFSNSVYLVGGRNSIDWEGAFIRDSHVSHTVLPLLGLSQEWTTVPDLYRGEYQCVLKIGNHLMAIIGGDSGSWGDEANRDVTMYNVMEKTTKVLSSLIQRRAIHGCILIQDNAFSSILVTGGYYYGGIKSTELLNLSSEGNNWVSTSDMDLAVKRYGHSMTMTKNGALVIGGQNDTYTLLKTIEIFNLRTQTWTEYGQSLSTGRSMFGGIMELPAVLFGCQTKPINITGCSEEYRYGKAFTGGSVTQVGQDETCHSVCEKDDNCLGWTWTKEEQCRIISQKSQLQTIHDKTGFTSGLKTSCKPKCYLVLSRGEEASTNTQFCENEDTETDCPDMIHMEPDDFQEGDDGNIKICNEVTGCKDVPYSKVQAACNGQPSIVTNSIHNRLRKRRFTRSNYVTLGG